MQELRLVLIIVGALAIAALLVHGLWTSKKEGKSKFAEKSIADSDDLGVPLTTSGEDVVVKKEKKDPVFGVKRDFSHDPLGVDDPLEVESDTFDSINNQGDNEDDLPHVTLFDDIDASTEDKVIFSDGDEEIILKSPKVTTSKSLSESTQVNKSDPALNTQSSLSGDMPLVGDPVLSSDEPEVTVEEEMQVIVINVHCSGDEPFVGTKLFDSMQQNGLFYGDMDIFHRHNDMSGTGKVLFSVANMMAPGTLKHDDPATFTTKGISFFMTLPGFGDVDQNFKLMLRTAQQIADDMGGNVLDEQRNLMTPDKLLSFKNQIRAFKARTAQL
ncbi:cell division protein ZipA [Vibrio sp. TH_r3]|uniref:cell division protein ZipA n=1 Tax=Vibrio sp. TH_r3 TaxID=3082084 RepID=UPI00295405D6|nr:cell division protein ZipA [Vibrio sp. TH_r3]MDV7103254.1 cell division protein ZipA [Vibrio sp. TH_r3]